MCSNIYTGDLKLVTGSWFQCKARRIVKWPFCGILMILWYLALLVGTVQMGCHLQHGSAMLLPLLYVSSCCALCLWAGWAYVRAPWNWTCHMINLKLRLFVAYDALTAKQLIQKHWNPNKYRWNVSCLLLKLICFTDLTGWGGGKNMRLVASL